MIPKECKRLIEVDFPMLKVSTHSATDKYVRHRPNAALHTWWAQRPLAACRAVLVGLLLPDPCDDNCPKGFHQDARNVLKPIQGDPGPKQENLRKALLRFIGDFADPNLSTNDRYLEAAEKLVKLCSGEGMVVDPFAGAGSIPLEALRLGLDVCASDLNPVAGLILKTALEYIPSRSENLVEELEELFTRINKRMKKELEGFYPANVKNGKAIAYLWAKTVKCERPNCGAEIPLIRSFWLSKKQNIALKYEVVRPRREIPHLRFEIFHPRKASDVPKRSVSHAKATCCCCESTLMPDRVRAQLSEQKGGLQAIFDKKGKRKGGALLIAVICQKNKGDARTYNVASDADYHAAWMAKAKLEKEAQRKLSNGLSPIPEEPLSRVPVDFGVINVWVYGIETWGGLFTARQNLAHITISRIIREETSKAGQELSRILLTFAFDKFLRHCNGNARWNNVIESVEPAFGTPSLPFTWTFPESVPWGHWAENFEGSFESIVDCLKIGFVGIKKRGQAEVADARKSPLPYESADIWFTDPPYYDNIPYSYISDFFYVWLKRLVPESHRKHFTSELTSKEKEIVAYNIEHDNTSPRQRFEDSMRIAFSEGRKVLKETGIGCVVFAHKTTEGWEALLSGMTKSGWVITASWPISTERAGRLRARDSAVLGASIHLVCRPREDDAGVGDWTHVLKALPKRIRDWIQRLDKEGIHGADLVFSCIGPALELFSRYETVETPEGRIVDLAEYLEKVWEVVGRTALEQVLGTDEARAGNGVVGVLEEDARLTALFLWTLMASSDQDSEESEDQVEDDGDGDEDSKPKKKPGFSLLYDVARRFAQPLGINLDNWKGRVIEIEKGVVRLLPVKERATQLFGEKGSAEIASRLERAPDKAQVLLFPSEEAVTEAPKLKGSKKAGRRLLEGEGEKPREATTLDRVHAAMLLQASGKSAALKVLIEAEQKRGPDFVRLANALSALYPKNSEEKRLLDAMLLAVPRR